MLQKKIIKKHPACHTMVSLDQFPGIGYDDMEWFTDLLGQ